MPCNNYKMMINEFECWCPRWAVTDTLILSNCFLAGICIDITRQKAIALNYSRGRWRYYFNLCSFDLLWYELEYGCFHKAFFKKEMQTWRFQILFGEVLLGVNVTPPFDSSPSYVTYICITARKSYCLSQLRSLFLLIWSQTFFYVSI